MRTTLGTLYVTLVLGGCATVQPTEIPIRVGMTRAQVERLPGLELTSMGMTGGLHIQDVSVRGSKVGKVIYTPALTAAEMSSRVNDVLFGSGTYQSPKDVVFYWGP